MIVNGNDVATPAVIVAIALHLALLTVGAYDVWAYYTHGHTWTASYVIRSWAAEYPILPLLIGTLLGHLFWWGGQ